MVDGGFSGRGSRATSPQPRSRFTQVVFAFYLAWLNGVSQKVIGAAGMVLPMIAVQQLSRTTIELTNADAALDLMVAAIEAEVAVDWGPLRGRCPSFEDHCSITRAEAGAGGMQVRVHALLPDVGKIGGQFERILAKEGPAHSP